MLHTLTRSLRENKGPALVTVLLSALEVVFEIVIPLFMSNLIDPGEEVLEQVETIAQAEQIKLASVQALGAVGAFTVGVFHTAEKQYHANSFMGDFEIVSLTGTINTMDGAFYAHLHMSAGNERGEVFGGHLNRAVVSATCEMVITLIDGRVDRFRSEEIGLNLFRF